MALRTALGPSQYSRAHRHSVFLAAPLAALGPCLPLLPARVAVPRRYRSRDTHVSVRKSRLGRHHLPARIATTLAILVCVMRAEALATLERLRMHVLARAAQEALLARTHPPLAPLAMVVAEEAAAAQRVRVGEAPLVVHQARLRNYCATSCSLRPTSMSRLPRLLVAAQ